MFDPIDPAQSFPQLEEGILQYWKEEDIFKRSLKRREKGEIFSFYDGPPFATGLPHYGHILAGTIKDVVPRYQTMRGKYVKRRFGWDCHGLPIENLIEKEKGLQSKKDIEELGVANFNELCRGSVQRYTKEWREVVERMGRWVDMDHDYRTMDPEYMESIWWVCKKLFEQELIYESHKSMHVCPRCQTPLSNFEVTQGYKDIQDYSITAMFEVVGEEGEGTEVKKGAKAIKGTKGTEVNKGTEGVLKTYFLAWTTTGWTLPGNLLLAVHPDTTYVTVACEGAQYILAKELLASVFKGKEYAEVSECAGKKLVGMHYHPLFPYFVDKYAESAFRVVEADFVTTTDGTGIVHIAPGYGEDDFNLGKREKLTVLQHVGIDGCFIKDVTDFAGKHAKPKDDHQSGDTMIAKWLKAKGKLFKAESYQHSYPHCWRCDSPLINYATSCWFVAVEQIKKDMLEANSKTSWVPAHIRDGRFGKWLEGARDWAISRNRFWGTPLPIWRNSVTGELSMIGSRDELMAVAPKRFTKIFVMRHAESEGNVQAIYQGKEPGTPLTTTGIEQAQKLADDVTQRSQTLPVGILYVSPLLRTRMTAEEVAKKTGAKIIIDERLREVDFGEYEGRHINFDDLAFIRERRAHKMETGKVESIYHFDGMETWSSVALRLHSFFEDILHKHPGEVIGIVTHADIVMGVQEWFTKESPHKIVHQPYPDLASLRTFYYDHERKAQMDLHKETVDSIAWTQPLKKVSKKKKDSTGLAAHPETVEVTFVRHGETEMNKLGIVQGSNVDVPLNSVGKKQAKAAGEALKKDDFDALVSSDLVRARETATIIAHELGMKVEATSEYLRERNTGDWSGKSSDEVRSSNGIKPHEGISFTRHTPPGGESFDQFISRARKAYDWLLQEYRGKKILVVAHGGMLKAMLFITGKMSYQEALESEPKNASTLDLVLSPQLRRIDEVLDCWFESGSMPYAQEHFPFEKQSDIPPHFPANFIAEGLDQTRGWFYTLMVLSSALFRCPAFQHCIVNGIVLAEDGKKMSKRLKNYPEPMAIVQKYGADAVRLALMSSPAVRGEDLRFSEKLVEEAMRGALLPLWNAYRLFVTYANAAQFKPSLDSSLKNAQSLAELDRWIIVRMLGLVDEMTKEFEAYDLSATASHFFAAIDDVTNWYVRLSRRVLAGKQGPEAQQNALDTLYRVLIGLSKLLAPFCPFIAEAMYLNLVGEDHDSIHFTDWPQSSPPSPQENEILSMMDATRIVTNLGLSLRSEAKIKVRQPIASITIALPAVFTHGIAKDLLMEELNAKDVFLITDASTLAVPVALVDARKVGPRLGKKVQDVIKAGKNGEFTERDGKIIILDEELTPDEVVLQYQGKEGKHVAADHGIVVTIDAQSNEDLVREGKARELIHAVQQLRKDAGLEFTDDILLSVHGADDVLEHHRELLMDETRSKLGDVDAKRHAVELDDETISIAFIKQ